MMMVMVVVVVLCRMEVSRHQDARCVHAELMVHTRWLVVCVWC